MDRPSDTGGVPALDTKPLIDERLFEDLRYYDQYHHWTGDTTYRFQSIESGYISYHLVRKSDRPLLYRDYMIEGKYYAYRLTIDETRVAQGDRIVNTLRLIMFPECSDE